jgi:hypothetical protein
MQRIYRNSFRSLIVRAQAAAMRKGGEERRDRSSTVLDSRCMGGPSPGPRYRFRFPFFGNKGPLRCPCCSPCHSIIFIVISCILIRRASWIFSIVVDQGQGSLPLGVQEPRSPDSKGGFRLRYELPRDCTRSPRIPEASAYTAKYIILYRLYRLGTSDQRNVSSTLR